MATNEDMEKIIQIISTHTNPTEYIVLTDKGNLFVRRTLKDLPQSQWEPIDLPDFKKKAPERKHK